jgi:hypothetical protein
MADANNIDPRKLSTAEFTGRLAPVTETWITGTCGPSTPQCSTSNEPSHDPRVTLAMSV